jgi:hypothetical protein
MNTLRQLLDDIESIAMAHYNDEITTEEMYDKIFELRKTYAEREATK